MNRKKIIIGAGASIVLAAVVVTVLWGTLTNAGAQTSATATGLPPVKDSGGVIADGRIVPASGAELAFPIGGVVSDVRVAEGRRVAAGAVLARLAGYEQAEMESALAGQELLAARQAADEVKRNGPLLAAQAALNEKIARQDKETAEANGWDTSNNELTRKKYALLAAGWQAALDKLDQYPDGVPVRELELAGARVMAAENRLAAAQAGLQSMELRAPVDGTVVYLDLTPGQVVAPGAVVAAVADLSVWQVKTVDLSEMDVIKVKAGDQATVTVDAFPGLELAGRVTGVGAYGQNRLGEIVYTVTISLDGAGARLCWNMTAMVNILPA